MDTLQSEGNDTVSLETAYSVLDEQVDCFSGTIDEVVEAQERIKAGRWGACWTT
jgi:hypothetical protein